jgi:hypothetical protein
MQFNGVLPPIQKVVLPKFSNGHWVFPEQMGNGVGFIYVIRDNFLDRFYLGKKQFYGMGVKNKGKESNWRKYASSSKALAEHFKERPKEEFDFICLEQYQTKGSLAYAETWSLCLVEAPTTKDWYNTRIEAISWNVKEPISDRHKARLQQTLRGEMPE